MSVITYLTEDQSGVSDYVFQFIASTLGVSLKRVGSGRPDILHANRRDAECAVFIPFREDDVIWRDLLDGVLGEEPVIGGETLIGGRAFNGGKAEAEPVIMPFDFVSGIAALLTDRVNRDAPESEYDEHDRLRFSGTFQARSGYAHVPIVNRYVEYAGTLLQRVFGARRIALWPDGKRFAIALSHDVDAPMRHGASGGPLYDPHASIRRNILTNLYRSKFSIERIFGATGLEHWHFPFIMDSESFRGFTSTFMFAPTRRFDPHGHPDFDVSYDVGSGRFRDLFGQLNYRGFEIGLHAGYLAFQDPDRLDDEREKLELLAQTPIRGIRHHAWHTGRDVEAALVAHERVGFEFDSSLAFNRSAVLRRSVALPYRPWSEVLRRPLDVMQIPVALMDGHIFYHQVSETDAQEQARGVVDRLRDVEGVGAIDWHVRTSSPQSLQFAAWGRTYLGLLDYLSEFDDAWVTSLGEINDWIRQREKVAAEGNPSGL